MLTALISACMLFLAAFAAAEAAEAADAVARPLEAEEIMQQIQVPDEDGTEGKTMDQVLFDANTQTGSKSYALPSGDVVVDGDMILTPRQYLASFGDQSGFGGAAIINENHLWPKSIIPWKMTDQFKESENGVKVVYAAMKEWMEKTCIVFTPAGSETHKSAGHDSKITIFTGIGCYSRVGFTGGHGVSLGQGCKFHGVALHELGHSIGLHHEQSRSDRDDSLKVLRQNANSRPGIQLNFEIQKNTNSRGIGYDFCSIMHYGNLAFSNNAHFTILTRNQDYQFTIGNPGKKHLTFEDAKIVNILYKCNSKCKSQPSCKEPCYVNHKCQCECPPKNHCPKKPCADYNPDTATMRTCAWAKKYNQCKGREDMARKCAESCGHCDYATKMLGDLIIDGSGGGGNGPSPTFNPNAKIGPKCRDDRFCGVIAGSISPGDCVGSNEHLVDTCPKKCGVCMPCRNKKPECEKWAKEGKCESQKRMMYLNCNEACKLCINP